MLMLRRGANFYLPKPRSACHVTGCAATNEQPLSLRLSSGINFEEEFFLGCANSTVWNRVHVQCGLLAHLNLYHTCIMTVSPPANIAQKRG